MKPRLLRGKPISSTRIRSALGAGDLEEANAMLGRPFSLLGKVIPGDSRGRKLGFPTANLDLLRPAFIPHGVYTARAWVIRSAGEQPDGPGFNAMLYLGHQPTYRSDTGRQFIEVHLLDFSADLYDELLQVQPLVRLREDRRFPSEVQLSEQISKDIQKAREILEQG